jgi:hypothetical protein
MSSEEEGILTRKIRALSHREKGPKPKANVLQIGPNFAGVAHVVPKAYTTKIGPQHLQGAAAPLVRPDPYEWVSGPSLVGYLSPPCQCWLLGCRPGSTHLDGGLEVGLVPSMRG